MKYIRVLLLCGVMTVGVVQSEGLGVKQLESGFAGRPDDLLRARELACAK